MKLSITQIVLGTLVLLTACHIVGWMIFGVPPLLTMPVPDDGIVMENTEVFPEHETLFAAARYAAGLLFGLGLVVLLTGAFQKRAESGLKLAITQAIAGVLIVAASVFILKWGYPTEFTIPSPEGSDILKHVFINPGPTIIRAERITGSIFLLGLAVFSVGIAQLFKARR